MNNREFSDNFDVLLNSYDSKAPFGDEASKQEISLNEYEKSVFLSMAEEDVVKSYFDKTLNQQVQGFDDSMRRQIDYSSLITVCNLNPLNYKQGFNSAVSGNTAEAVISSGTRQAGNLLRAGYTPKNLGSIEIAHQPTGDKTEYINLITNPSIVSWLSRIYADKLHISDNYDIAYDSKTNEELKVYTFSTNDTNTATLYNNQIWYGKKMFEEAGVGNKPLYIIVEYDRAPKRAIVRLVDTSALSEFPVKEIDTFSFTGVLYREMVSPPTGRIPEDPDNPDFKGSMEMNVEGAASLVTYATIYLDINEPNVAYPDPVGRGSLNYCYLEPIHKMDDANFKFLDLVPKTVFFDKTVNTVSPVVQSVMNGGYLTNTRAIEVVSKSSWLNTYTTKRNGEFYCDISLNPSNGTNNTGKIREGYVDVLSYKQIGGGATETYTGRIYVFQYTTDTPVPTSIGLDVTPSKLTFDGIYGSTESKSISVVVEGGADYSVSLENPADTWLHIEKRENISGGETIVWCDANDGDSERVGYIVFTAGEGATETTKEVMVVQTPSDRLNPPEIKTTESTIYFASTAGETKILYIDLKRASRYSTGNYDYGDYSPWFVVGTEYNDRIEVICTQDNNTSNNREGYFHISATGDSGLTTTISIKVVQGLNEAVKEQEDKEKEFEASLLASFSQNRVDFEAYESGSDCAETIKVTTNKNWKIGSISSDYFACVPDFNSQTITIYPKSVNLGALRTLNIPVLFYDAGTTSGSVTRNILVTQKAKSQSDTQDSSSEGVVLSIDTGNPKGQYTFEIGPNGGDCVFKRFWYTGGNLIPPEVYGTWFGLSASDSYKNTDTSNDKENYNPFGKYIRVSPNTMGGSRSGTVIYILEGPESFTKIQINIIQYAEDSSSQQEQEEQHPIPTITCDDTITVGYDEGSTMFPITFTDVDWTIQPPMEPYIARVPVGSFVTVLDKKRDGIVIGWTDHTGSTSRNSKIFITAYNSWNSSETKVVTLTQMPEEEQQPEEPEPFILAKQKEFVLRSTPEEGQASISDTIVIDSNIPDINAEEYKDDFDWLEFIDAENGTYPFSVLENTENKNRTGFIKFFDENETVVEYVEIKQLCKPQLTLQQNTITDYAWAGTESGILSIPFTSLGISTAVTVSSYSYAYCRAAVDETNLKVSVSANISGSPRTIVVTIHGENELGEYAEDTLIIHQGTKPVGGNNDSTSSDPGTTPGGSDSGSDQPSSGTDYTDTSETVYSTNFDERGIIFRLPKRILTNSYTQPSTDVLFILQEKLLVKSPSDSQYSFYTVKPISYTEYDRLMSKAYASPLKRQAWRLFQNQSTGFDILSEIIPANAVNVTNSDIVYRIRYVRRPKPIILEDLPDGLQIDGYTKETTCEINPILHQDILVRAVQLALASKGRQTNSTEKQ